MDLNKPLDRQIKEIYERYPSAVDYLVDFLHKRRSQSGLIGENQDETLIRVYKQAGYFECLQDILKFFRP